ncbi:MAG: DUF2752 domain-containing protein [Flavobacterium sp.]|nr:MAG: DUF2752 domain-containing protein [Flavobacterium sp.]
MEKYMIPCMNKALFGFDCPGCGLQRSFFLLCQGHFSDAFFMFPAIYTTITFFVLVGLHFVDRSHNYHRAIIWMAIANGAITIVSYIIKITSVL